MSLEDLTDKQFDIVMRALPFPTILADAADKTIARALAKKGWGSVEEGASGEMIFRLNQAGEDQARWESLSWSAA